MFEEIYACDVNFQCISLWNAFHSHEEIFSTLKFHDQKHFFLGEHFFCAKLESNESNSSSNLAPPNFSSLKFCKARIRKNASLFGKKKQNETTVALDSKACGKFLCFIQILFVQMKEILHQQFK